MPVAPLGLHTAEFRTIEQGPARGGGGVQRRTPAMFSA